MIDVPVGAIMQPITLSYQTGPALPGAAPGTRFIFAGVAFTLTASNTEGAIPGMVFAQPVTITLYYTDVDVIGLNEAELRVLYFNTTSQRWQTDGIAYVARDTVRNRIMFTVSHLTQFGLFGAHGTFVFLPMIR